MHSYSKKWFWKINTFKFNFWFIISNLWSNSQHRGIGKSTVKKLAKKIGYVNQGFNEMAITIRFGSEEDDKEKWIMFLKIIQV